jgi:phosphoenolpyruvate-protein phosphotransferase
MTTVERAFQGVPAAGGVVIAPWAALERPALDTVSSVATTGRDLEADLERIRDAIAVATRDLEDLAAGVSADGHATEAGIFRAQAEMARDPALLDGARAEMAERGADPVGAVVAASAAIAAILGSLDDPLLAARAADVRDVGDRIASHLAGVSVDVSLASPAIVVADDLTPSVTATLPRDKVLGVVLGGSSPTAHAAILARAYGIPAIVGATAAVRAIRSGPVGTTLAIDGETGEIVIDPDAVERRRFETAMAAVEGQRRRDREDAAEPVETTDGVGVTLYANIGSPAEADGAVELGARGVGLFRTEFLFLERPRPPSEEEQVAEYTAVVTSFGGDPVTIRLLDVGGDKPIPYLPIPREDNPFLGVRALRLAATHADLFVTQLRACYRAASCGPVRVMAPMVADAGDVAVLADLAARARAEASDAGHPVGDIELGVMLEIPSAILTLPSYAGRIAFASIGTNDLLQYTLAVDRGNPALERYRDPLHPAVLSLVRTAVETADEAGIELSVCGEMAGDPTGAVALVGLGLRALSMSPASLAAVRRALRAASAEDLRREALAALGDEDATQVRRRFA